MLVYSMASLVLPMPPTVSPVFAGGGSGAVPVAAVILLTSNLSAWSLCIAVSMLRATT